MVELIRSSPFIDAFDNRIAKNQQRRANDQQMEAADMALETRRATQQGNIAGTNADNQRRIIDAQIAEETAPNRTRLSDLSVTKAENEMFFQAIDMASQGDIQGARAIAARSGANIPDGVLEDRNLMGRLKAFSDRARTLYPNNPRQQQTFMEAAVASLTGEAHTPESRIAQAHQPGPANHNTRGDYLYIQPSGAPAPAAASIEANGGNSVFDRKYQLGISLGYSPQEAYDMAMGIKSPTAFEIRKMAIDEVEAQYRGSFASDPDEKAAAIQTKVQELERIFMGGGLQSAPIAPQGAPAQPATGDIPVVKSPEEAKRLPPDVPYFQSPDGRTFRNPNYQPSQPTR